MRLIIDENVNIDNPIVNNPRVFLSDKNNIVILNKIIPRDEINFKKKVGKIVSRINFLLVVIISNKLITLQSP
ncbi:hypothetical protein OAP76_04455 [Alphaproteobacteria bacterium]|nr:hypothetical protein [Alphaproteobacteria bacterium]